MSGTATPKAGVFPAYKKDAAWGAGWEAPATPTGHPHLSHAQIISLALNSALRTCPKFAAFAGSSPGTHPVESAHCAPRTDYDRFFSSIEGALWHD